jgi:hypothetical protein
MALPESQAVIAFPLEVEKVLKMEYDLREPRFRK